ncbi:hypothetical protein CHH58_16070 [Terribacillus saccharophilus]|uniref:pyocin knob domain-containing protein n=1 Tax=Terribacillus saccharophilus TaxID=361277 RepID=UPI000BA76C4E|nr:pyocin knob domain-containing protein [Terribacillus saccharophilus]PAF35570.1 hypothetical protein CHH58_16070 [Terribacillus saccharophilus]
MIQQGETESLQIAVNFGTLRTYKRYSTSAGVWGNWKEDETTEGAQAKANAVNTQQVNSMPTKWKTASALPGTYPIGITEFSSGNDNTFPAMYALVTTIRADNGTATVQYCTAWNNAKSRTWVRSARDVENVWQEWVELETTAGAQAKADAVKAYVQQYGLGVAARSGIDWNAIATTGFYAGSTNGPSGNSTYIGIHVQHGSAYAYQEVGRNGIYYKRTRENGEWTKWEQTETVSGSASRVLTARDEAISRAVAQAKSYTDEKNDYEVYWTNATWRSGHSGDLQWCIKAGFLVVKGMWNNTGETGIQIASVPAAPKYRTYINAPTIGSYGEVRVTLGNDGVITVDGLNANNNASVTRLEILFVIPVESRG